MPTRRISSVAVAALLVAVPHVAVAQRQATQSPAGPSTKVQLAAGPTSASAQADEDIPVVKVHLSRRNVFAPGALRSIVSVAPHADNRVLRIAVDSPEYYRSSDIQLDGAGAPVSHDFSLQSLPAAEYTLEATVFGTDGRRGASRLEFSVLAVAGR